MSSTPGQILPGGIILIDEPEHANVTTFADTGEVLMTFDCRPGGNCGQVILGLTPNQALQLAEMLMKHNDACLRAVLMGNGGARFVSRSDTDGRG